MLSRTDLASIALAVSHRYPETPKLLLVRHDAIFGILAQIRHPVAVHVVDLVCLACVVLQDGVLVAVAELVEGVIEVRVLLLIDVLVVLHRGWRGVVNSQISSIECDVAVSADILRQKLPRGRALDSCLPVLRISHSKVHAPSAGLAPVGLGILIRDVGSVLALFI